MAKLLSLKSKKHYVNGILYAETYFNDKNMIHRDANSYGGDGPAEIRYARDNKNNKVVIHEMWYKNGKAHRDDNLPAMISYSDDGKTVTLKEWYIDGCPVSKNGGAYCNIPPVKLFGYDDDSQIIRLVKAIQNLDMKNLDKCIEVIESFKTEK